MKRFLSLLMAAMLVFSLAACSQPAPDPAPAEEPTPAPAPTPEPEPAGVPDGTYEGIGHGFKGEVKVAVTVAGNALTDVQVVEHHETAGVSDLIIESMPQRILEAQSYEVDLVSGATYTANAIKQAAKAALTEAGAEVGMFDAVPPAPAQQDTERTVDVVVVGAGLAGLSAAIEAKEAGADVVILEKLGRIGGNSVVSGGIVYATGSPLNKDMDDDVDALVEYYQFRANGKADEALIRHAAENSGGTIEWMMAQGVQFNPEIGKGGLSPALRAHSSPDMGAGIVVPIYEKAKQLGIEILLETPAIELKAGDDGAVNTVVAQSRTGKITFTAKAVVMASGGFDGSESMRDIYAPHAKGAVVYSSKGNDGDYIAMGEAVGAAMQFTDAVMGMRIINPNAYLTDGVNILAWLNTVAVTDEGVRFENENDDYPVNFTNMMNTGRDTFYWIHDSSVMGELCELAVSQNYGFKADTIEDLATAAGMDPAVLKATVDRYNSFAGGKDEDFGKEGIVALSESGPYYAIRVRPATIAGFGGFMINTGSQALNAAGEPIPGLYAAGECASGQFFDHEYAASGTMLNFSTVFGRGAGQNAAAYAKQ